MYSQKLIETLFAGSKKSLSAYPIRAVYMTVPQAGGVRASVLISVSKRHLKHAVDRNRVKRQIREAYRLHKDILWPLMEGRTDAEGNPQMLAVAFIWLSDDLFETAVVERKIVNLLTRITENLPENQIPPAQ